MIRVVVFTIVCLLCISTTFGQAYHTRNFTTKDGLPSNFIRDILKDSKGNLWIGTDGGLCRFNGKKFIPIQLGEKNQSNKVWAIEEDDDGNIWFGSYGSGLFRFDGETIKNFSSPELTHNHIRVLQYLKHHKLLLIGTEHGLTVYKDSTFYKFSQKDMNVNGRIQCMGFIDKGDSIYIHCFKPGMYAYLPKLNEVITLDNQHSLYQESSSGSFVSSNGDILQGVRKNGLKITNDSTFFEFKDLGQVFDMTEDSDGNVWIASWSYIDMPEPGGFFKLTGRHLEWMNTRLGIESKMAWCLHYDRDRKAMWMGTSGDGLYLYLNNGISYYRNDIFDFTPLNSYSLKIEDEQLLLSTDNCLYKGNVEDGFKKIDGRTLLHRSSSGYINSELSKLPKEIKNFLHIERDCNGKLWIGTDKGLFRENKDGNYTFFEKQLWEPQCFTTTNDGLLLGGGWSWHSRLKGIFGDSLTCSHYRYDASKPYDVNKIVKRGDEIWFASWVNGLYCYKGDEYLWINEKDSILPKNVKDLCLDKHNNLVAGTNNGHVIIFNYSDSIEIKYELTPQSGIVGNSIQLLHVSNSNHLWIGTNTALNVLSLDNFYETGDATIRSFNESEGFSEYQVKTVAEDSKGNLWLGGKESLVKIDTKKLLASSFKSKIKLDELLVNNVVSSPKELYEYNENSFVFEVSSLNRINPYKDHFAVKLEGFDNGFSDWTINNRFVYTNLNSGRYKLIVNGKNLSCGEKYEPLMLELSINPPWWQAWWFYSILVIGSAFTIWGFVGIRIRRIKRQEETKRELEVQITSLKNQAIQAQMNPHFIFNAITSVQSFMLSNENDAALDYLMLFADLIRKTLDLVSEPIIKLSEEIAYIDTYIKIESMRFESGIAYQVEIDEGIDAEGIFIPPLLLQPFVENAIKHGLSTVKGEKSLFVKILSVNNEIKISIRDNGVGRQKAGEFKKFNGNGHVSKGLKITEERIRQMYTNAPNDLYGVNVVDLYDGNKAVGTDVIIKLPLIVCER